MFAKLIFWYVSFFWQSGGTSETGKSGRRCEWSKFRKGQIDHQKINNTRILKNLLTWVTQGQVRTVKLYADLLIYQLFGVRYTSSSPVEWSSSLYGITPKFGILSQGRCCFVFELSLSRLSKSTLSLKWNMNPRSVFVWLQLLPAAFHVLLT